MMTTSAQTKRLSDDALTVWNAGVAGVEPSSLVENAIDWNDGVLHIVELPFMLDSVRRIAVVGGGKATGKMVAGLERALEPLAGRLDIDGLVSVPAGTAEKTKYIEVRETRPLGANEPTAAAAAATAEMLQLASQLDADDLCLVLLSGGGSALLPAPRQGLSLEDKLAVTRHLSEAGANIEQLNRVRRNLSCIKGGGLARCCSAGNLVALIISDVLGDPLETIASGPTVPVDDDPNEALDVLRQFDPEETLPAAVYRVLRDAVDGGPAEEGSWPEVHNIIIGNNAVAVDSAGIQAEQLGYSHAMHSATASEGEAEEVGQQLARMTLKMLREAGPDCLITGGEPIVRLIDSSRRGRGGRNQQLVLSALIWLRDHGDLSSNERNRFALLSGGTDGEDGPTDAAGALLNAEVWQRSESLGLDPIDYLQRNDAYTFFEQAGGLIKTGPTGTNVCDLRVACVQRR